MPCMSLESSVTKQYGCLVAPYVHVQQSIQSPDPEIHYDTTNHCNLSLEAVHLHKKTASNDSDAQLRDYMAGSYTTELSGLFNANEQHQHQWWMHVDNGSPNSHSSPTPSGSPTPSWNGEVEDCSRSPLGSIRCNYTGCTFRRGRREALRHHQRSHIPMAERPYPCPNCPMRFLYPREVGRHLTTHGIGARHYCPHDRCRYATEGFGRRDHLVRHVRAKHIARSVH